MNSIQTGQMNFNRYLYDLSGGLFHTVIAIKTEYSGWRIVDSISASYGNGTRLGMTYSGEKIVCIFDGEFLPFCSTCFDEFQRMRFLVVNPASNGTFGFFIVCALTRIMVNELISFGALSPMS